LENFEMKKTLVALAAFAATASFADVTVTGTFDPTVQKTTTSYGAGTTQFGQTNMTYNGRGTSQVTFKISEDLGAGLSAIAMIENDFYAQNQEDRQGSGGASGQVSQSAATTNFGAKGGEVYTGLTGGFGTVKLGSPNTPTLAVQAANPFGTKIGSGFGESVLGTGHVRNSQTVNYTSPVFSGFTFAYAHTFGANANASASTAVTALGAVDDTSLTYANGPIAAGLSYYKMADVAGTNDNHLTSYFGSYTFGAAKLMVGGHQESNGLYGSQQTGLAAAAATFTPLAGNDHNGTYVAGTYTSGATTFLFNLATRQDKTVANANNPQNMHMTAFGLDYALSKNTTVYARYSNYTQDNVSGVATAVAKETKTAAGV
jgi:predicted porin